MNIRHLFLLSGYSASIYSGCAIIPNKPAPYANRAGGGGTGHKLNGKSKNALRRGKAQKIARRKHRHG